MKLFPFRPSTFSGALSALLALALMVGTPAVQAQAQPQSVQPQQQIRMADAPQRQDLPSLQQLAEQFLQSQAAGMPGEVTVSTDPVDSRLSLTACFDPQAFMPNGARLWGRTTVGIKCVAPAPWTIYVRANIRVIADYLVAATPLRSGQTIGAGDITRMHGDLSTLPNGVATDENQVIGRISSMALRAGTPLRMDALRSQQVVQQGQTVRIVSNGPGFQISAEARALSNASEGQTAQARTAAGQVISGIAKAGGILEVNY